LLYDGKTIGEVNLCVNTKAITLYGLGVGVLVLRKIREVDQEKFVNESFDSVSFFGKIEHQLSFVFYNISYTYSARNKDYWFG